MPTSSPGSRSSWCRTRPDRSHRTASNGRRKAPVSFCRPVAAGETPYPQDVPRLVCNTPAPMRPTMDPIEQQQDAFGQHAMRDATSPRGIATPMSARQQSRQYDAKIEQLRVPPQSVDAEQAVLGGLMLDPGAFDRIADQLNDDDFYRRDHQLIYRAIRELAEKQPAVRRGDPGRMVRVAGPGRAGRRWRLPGRTGQHHAIGRQHQGLCRDRPRQGGAAAADRRRHRASSTTASSPKAATARELLAKAEQEVFAIAEAGAAAARTSPRCAPR